MVDAGQLVKISVGLVFVIAVLGGGLFSFSGDATHVAFDSETKRTGVPKYQNPDQFRLSSGLGDKIELTGANDSVVQTDEPVQTDSTFAVCTLVTADSKVVANNESRAIAGAAGASLYYNGTADEYRVWWYNESSQTAYDAAVPAPSPTDRTLVCGQHNGTHLVASRNTTVGDAVNTTVNIQSAPSPPSANWDGTVEETRVFDHPLNASQRQDYLQSPALSLNTTAPTMRLMYDVRDRGTSRIPAYFHSGGANVSNASFVDGLAPPAITEGQDYRLSDDKEEITLLDGRLTRGDVLFVRYEIAGGPGIFVAQMGLALAAFSLVVIPLMREVQ